MIKLQIKTQLGSVIFEHECEGNSISKTVKAYIDKELETKWRANLTGADLTRANLTGADLTDANLTGADLTDADLTRADLTDADLTRADLTRANLTRADLTRADLTGADLTDADLTRADLTRANLTGADLTDADLTDADLTDADLTDADLTRADLTRANLTDANLTDANLTIIKNDFWAKLLKLQNEIPAFKEKIKAGKINGSCYEGACCCFVGTFANIKGVRHDKLDGIYPDSDSPTERWFLAIQEGHTPENSAIVKITLDWIEEFELYTNINQPA